MRRPRPMLALLEGSLKLLDRLHARKSPYTTGETFLDAQKTGEAGERAAYFHLRRQGFTVVARRWRHPALDGEVDLIAWEGETLCFVEVKTRDAATPFAAEFAVDSDKQETLHRMADAYTAQMPWPNRQPASISRRFDIVSAYRNADGTHDLRLLRNAFR